VSSCTCHCDTPLALFKDREDADVTLKELRDAYTAYLRAREKPASPKTIAHHTDAVLSLEKSLVLLGQLTPQNVPPGWPTSGQGRCRARAAARRRRAPTRRSVRATRPLTSFNDKYILKGLKLTRRDLLEDVERFEKELPTKKALGQDEIAAVLACFYLPTFEHIRDRAIFEIHMATAFRFDTVRAMPLASLNRMSGEVDVITKGGEVMQGRIDSKALARVRTYLRMRPDTDSPALFVTDAGKAISYNGGRMIWPCIQKRSGVKRLGAT